MTNTVPEFMLHSLISHRLAIKRDRVKPLPEKEELCTLKTFHFEKIHFALKYSTKSFATNLLLPAAIFLIFFYPDNSRGS
jgi:hypothetical protein